MDQQNLRIKAFYGLSENAVKTQIWIAINSFLVIAILKKQLDIAQSMSRILQVVSVNVFSKDPIHQLFSEQGGEPTEDKPNNQMIFKDL